MTSSNEQTDVHVVSLDDRRKIRDLEAKAADLEQRLAEALGRVRPAMEREHGQCLHMGAYVVSDDDLEVTCKACGAEVEPYEVLRRIAHREVNFCYTLNSLRTEAEQLRAEVDKLKAARSRIRRRVRRSEDVSPAGIATIMRTYKLSALSVVMGIGGTGGMALATLQGDWRQEKQLRADGVDVEDSLSKLVAALEERSRSASTSSP